MERLRQSDLTALLDNLERLYALGTLEQFRRGVLAPVARLIPGVRYGYVESDLGRGRVTAQVDPPDAMPPGGEATLQRHVHEHPLTIRYQQTGDRGPYMVSDFVTRREFHRLGIYDAVYRPIGAEDLLSVVLAVGGPHMAGVGVNRDHTPFSERDRLVMQRLSPHLIRAYRNATILTRLERGIASAGLGLLVLDHDGCPTRVVGLSEQLLASYFADQPPGHAGIPMPLLAWLRAQRGRLADRDDAPSPPDPLVVEDPHGRLVANLMLDPTGAPTVILEEEPALTLTPSALMALSLSRREAEVLALIAAGRTDGEVADLLSVSPRTVQKHLANVYDRLGVRTRTAAAALAFQAARGGIGSPR